MKKWKIFADRLKSLLEEHGMTQSRFDNFTGRDTDIDAETLELSRKVLGI